MIALVYMCLMVLLASGQALVIKQSTTELPITTSSTSTPSASSESSIVTEHHPTITTTTTASPITINSRLNQNIKLNDDISLRSRIINKDEDPLVQEHQLQQQQNQQQQQQQPSRSIQTEDKSKKMYFETEQGENAASKDDVRRVHGKNIRVNGPLNPWSIVWYIGSFGGLVAFFLIVSCSEWCCRRGARQLSAPYGGHREMIGGPTSVVETSPPPPYHLFAPPPYDSINYADFAPTDKSSANEKLDIYVITLPPEQPRPA